MVKVSAGATTVRIPRQRGRRQDSFLLVVPERPSLTARALHTVGLLLWRQRLALLPTATAVLLLLLAAILHVLAPWAGVLVAVAGLLPLLVLAIPPLRRRVKGGERSWQWAAAAAAAVVGLWTALAILLGPLCGPLGVLWFLGLLGAQGAWFVLRRSISKETD
ncbi:hypothetical protein [Streptomyces sp. AN091965]|uniref:hypothetical protein n=1 Tax=Streptomyces sp. AN091965 TaxID=2927803 RepID=UPI001F606466|nr:hypothetical protein [Streptomyces sp. AN091965]MCI3930267.1 hypothetical protein [Streptomyces sp. AN091965]